MATGVVGRAELAAVDDTLAAARERVAVLLLEGDPGIGKTTVWREEISRARARGYRVLACRAGARRSPSTVNESCASTGD